MIELGLKNDSGGLRLLVRTFVVLVVSAGCGLVWRIAKEKISDLFAYFLDHSFRRINFRTCCGGRKKF